MLVDDSRSYVCQGDTMNIGCKSGKFIYVTSVFYGRRNRLVCDPTDKYGYFSEPFDCEASNSLQKVEDLCNGKISCEFQATNALFGDPCSGTDKYLAVEYSCIEGMSFCIHFLCILQIQNQVQCHRENRGICSPSRKGRREKRKRIKERKGKKREEKE